MLDALYAIGNPTFSTSVTVPEIGSFRRKWDPTKAGTRSRNRVLIELRWSLALFTQQPLSPATEWLQPLKNVTEADGVRVLEHRVHGDLQFFLLSILPNVAPPQIVKSVKGRLQHLIQKQSPNAFRRNFRLTSIGGANRETIEAYVSGQLGHHHMADSRVDRMLAEFQLEFPEIDLTCPQRSAHGEYSYNLHVANVHADRWNEVRREKLQTSQQMILRCARAKQHQLSRLALLANHVHLALGVPYEMAPGNVALSYLNNIAFAHGMTAMFRPSYYVGTFGEHDMNAVRAGS